MTLSRDKTSNFKRRRTYITGLAAGKTALLEALRKFLAPDDLHDLVYTPYNGTSSINGRVPSVMHSIL
jgi:hypothetical protein